MRFAKIIAGLTLLFWLVQSLTFVLFFASSFTDLIVRLFVSLGLAFPETFLTAFLHAAMNVLSWPIRDVFPSTWAQAGSAKAILLLALNSLIWGLVLGTVFYFAMRHRRHSRVSHS